MYLHVVSAKGAYTSIDLVHLPLWRLWLMAKEANLTLVLSYDSGATRGDVIVAQVNVLIADEAKNIADIGFVDLNKDVSRRRLEEAAKVLYNHEQTRKEAEALVPQVGRLADVYFGILDALSDAPAEESALNAKLGALLKGEMGGYRFAVTTARFEPWRMLTDTIDSGKDVAAPIDGLTLAPASPAATAAGAGPGGKPPPDATSRPPSLSREQRRTAGKAGAKATPGASPSGAPGIPPGSPGIPPASPAIPTEQPSATGGESTGMGEGGLDS